MMNPNPPPKLTIYLQNQKLFGGWALGALREFTTFPQTSSWI